MAPAKTLPVQEHQALADDKMQAGNQSLTFQGMLDEIRLAFSRPDARVDADELWKVLENYKSDPSDWSKFSHYDMHSYKRNLVDEDENYNVMIICWGPNVKSCIHDHSGSHCFMKVLEGELIESRFAWPESQDDAIHRDEGDSDDEGRFEDQEMSLISDSRMGKNDVLYITDKVGLHQVENPNVNRYAVSLHVYLPPMRSCKAFDQRTGRARECKLTFYSKRGEITEN